MTTDRLALTYEDLYTEADWQIEMALFRFERGFITEAEYYELLAEADMLQQTAELARDFRAQLLEVN